MHKLFILSHLSSVRKLMGSQGGDRAARPSSTTTKLAPQTFPYSLSPPWLAQPCYTKAAELPRNLGQLSINMAIRIYLEGAVHVASNGYYLCGGRRGHRTPRHPVLIQFHPRPSLSCLHH